jgi:hypothetical protein
VRDIVRDFGLDTLDLQVYFPHGILIIQILAAKNGMDARRKFLWVEGLCNVIICAGSESAYFVSL